MLITLLQIDILQDNVKGNKDAVEHMLLSAPKSDVYVLPEMWSTGFVTKPASCPNIAENASNLLPWLQSMSQRLDAAIACSMAVRLEDGSYRNRFYFITPTSIVHYDKRHLFTYAGEDKHYVPTSGGQVIAEWQGVRFLLQVCYDLRFPIYSRNKANDDHHLANYDVALYVASWPESRIEAWRTLLKARAIENQCYVCGVNRVGDDTNCHYNGYSAFVTPYGNATECVNEGPESLTQSIDIEKLVAFRKKFPVLRDQ